jgi:hypothetical protein
MTEVLAAEADYEVAGQIDALYERASNNPCTCNQDENSCRYCNAWSRARRESCALVAAHRIAGQAELVEAAREVLSHRVGDLPTRGWLKDNDGSRASLAKLAAALQPLSQAGGERS